jgi:phage terminase large subunit-like protein
MLPMTRVVIPYRPRKYQLEIHQNLEKQRFNVLVAHRRMGKTVLSVNHLIKSALTAKRSASRFGYIAPFRVQAKMIAWDYVKRFSGVIPGVRFNEQELSVTFPNGSLIRLFGADNPDSLRGGYWDGVVLDEVAQIKPDVWQEILRPALADRGGWATFIGTPKGINLFKDIYDKALSEVHNKNGDWWVSLKTIDDTKALPESEIDEMQKSMSDRVWRQEMMCDFSAEADDVLIPIDLVSQAVKRAYLPGDIGHAPVVLGIDVARFGNDASVIFRRQGLQAFEPVVIRGMDNMALAGRIVSIIAQYKPASVFIDAGQGAGVIDRIRQLGHSVIEVPFSSSPFDPRYLNKRAEMWYDMKKWLSEGGAIPDDLILKSDLSAPVYFFNNSGKIQLEAKEKIKERIGRSPDLADGLALTFAYPVTKSRGVAKYISKDYDPFA